jgi:hypothetical protein
MDIKELKKQITPTLEKYGVRRASLFGSSARGQETPDSDIDILVELKEGKTLLDLVRLENELKDILGKEVDLLTYNSLHPKIKGYAQQDEVKLYK